MEKIAAVVKSLLPLGPMDAVSVGVIDFKAKAFELVESESSLFYDLASLTKPLSNSLSYFLIPQKFTNEMLLCLNHRGGLPAWGLLPKKGWREQILSYPVSESETLYSDFSALRVYLELDKIGVDQKKLCERIWDKETLYWTDLPSNCHTLQYGFKGERPNFKAVHDPNAWVIGSYCSHAGLFSTIQGLCRTLLEYEEQTGFIDKVRTDLQTHKRRFSYGWDRVMNTQDTLAGKGCGQFTFGHLGFTGTSIWIDPERMLGQVILSNSTKKHWYDKANLNDIRRAVGELIWKNDR